MFASWMQETTLLMIFILQRHPAAKAYILLCFASEGNTTHLRLPPKLGSQEMLQLFTVQKYGKT